MGLYWVRPFTFINLDSTNRAFITDVDNMPHYFTTIFSDINKGIPDGTSYLFMCEQAKNALKQKEYEYHSFPELSYCAWKNNQETPDEPATNRVDSNVKEIDYWIYSPGDNACMWDELQSRYYGHWLGRCNRPQRIYFKRRNQRLYEKGFSCRIINVL